MRDSLFHTTVEMPPKSNSPDVVRVALTRQEMQRDLLPAAIFSESKDVKHVEPPHRGKHY